MASVVPFAEPRIGVSVSFLDCVPIQAAFSPVIVALPSTEAVPDMANEVWIVSRVGAELLVA